MTIGKLDEWLESFVGKLEPGFGVSRVTKLGLRSNKSVVRPIILRSAILLELSMREHHTPKHRVASMLRIA